MVDVRQRTGVRVSAGVTNLALVGLGGMLGAVCRYLASLAGQSVSFAFPLGTLASNLLGCFIIGIVMQLAFASSWPGPEGRLFLATGFCGGFTTMSSFVYELSAFLQDKEYFWASVYFGGTLLGSMLCFYLGVVLVAASVR